MALIDFDPPFTATAAAVIARSANNPFYPHNIRHLSPSSCALWVAQPAAWVLRYLLKRDYGVGAAAHRGTAVESGVVHGLMTGETEPGCTAVAVREFDRLTALGGDSRREKERDGIAGMVGVGLKELLPYGQPAATQRQVHLEVDGLAVPFTGYLDLEYRTQGGIIIDLKTLHALPSSIRTAHARQVAFYLAATSDNYEGRVTYVTSKKAATYTVENPRKHFAAMVAIAHTIQRFVALSRDPMELAMLVAPDTDSFYWSDPMTRRAAEEVWGF